MAPSTVTVHLQLVDESQDELQLAGKSVSLTLHAHPIGI
jgi:hypothetical protein